MEQVQSRQPLRNKINNYGKENLEEMYLPRPRTEITGCERIRVYLEDLLRGPFCL
jgi:hypothetical protein